MEPLYLRKSPVHSILELSFGQNRKRVLENGSATTRLQQLRDEVTNRGSRNSQPGDQSGKISTCQAGVFNQKHEAIFECPLFEDSQLLNNSLVGPPMPGWIGVQDLSSADRHHRRILPHNK